MAAPAAADERYTLSADRPLNKKPKRLPWPMSIYQTAVGKKWVMAVTGLMLVGFVLVHMFGNLKLYLGVVTHNGEQIYDADAYAHTLRELFVPVFPSGLVLWLMRIGLIFAFGFHIHAAYSLTRSNWVANRQYESKRDWLAANFASRSMRYTGVIVGLYLVFHLADLTWGWITPDWEHGAVQHNVVESLSNPLIATVYIVANIAVSIHIYHGMYSLFQTLGLSNPGYNWLRQGTATVIALAILIGNVSFPIAVLTGIIDFDPSLVAAH